jgi:hypothetical protein
MRYCPVNRSHADDIKALNRQAHRWYIASKQDQHPIIKNLHANYAVGYVNAMRDIAPDDEIDYVTGLSIANLSAGATREQDRSIAQLARYCPDLIPRDRVYLAYLKKMNRSNL